MTSRPDPAFVALLVELDGAMRRHDPDLYTSLHEPATPEQLKRIAVLSRAVVPSEVEAMYLWKGGQSALTQRNLFGAWRWLQADEMEMELRASNELFDRGEFRRPMWWNPRWLPLFGNDDGDVMVFDQLGAFDGRPGQLLQVSMERGARTVHYPSLSDLLGRLVRRYIEPIDPGYPAGYPKVYEA